MQTCTLSSFFDFENKVVRALWSAGVPLIFVIGCIITRLFGSMIRHRWFTSFLTLDEAEELDENDGKAKGRNTISQSETASLTYAQVALSTLAFIEFCAWILIGYYFCFPESKRTDSCNWNTVNSISSFAIAFTWLYATILPQYKPKPTAPSDLFILYLLYVCCGALMVIGYIFYQLPPIPSLPERLVIIQILVHFSILIILLVLVLRLPLNIPRGRLRKDLNPEDYTSLWGSVTFSWITPLLESGSQLKGEILWGLSPTMRINLIMRKLELHSGESKSLLWKLWEINSLDIFFDFIGALFSVFFHYCNPFLLKLIVDNLDRRGRESPGSLESTRTQIQASTFAFLMFLALMSRSEVQLQHNPLGRRIAAKTRSYLMALIFNKTLKRRCLTCSGYSDSAGSGKKAQKGLDHDERSNAEAGRVYNMMAGDAMSIGNIYPNIYFLYGFPFELAFASTLLYKLLGISAFIGLGTAFALAWPINHAISSYSIRMQKNLVSSLDLRTNILNELLTGLRTIKYFSWEKHWIDRTLEARNTELHYLYRKNVASLAIYILWISVPIAASAISFGVHIGFFGKQLDIGSAFTAIQLFSMVREPLHIIPRMVLQLMEAKLAIDRIQAYIEKEEYNKFPLSDDTIVLEKPAGFGFHNASFMWAQSSESKRGNYITTLSEGNGKNSYKTQDFSLTNISIVFPEDSITLVIGPTGSGKSSLLMALLGEMILNSGQILSPRDHLTYNEGGFTSSISYAAQIPWLQHQSIRENILFGSQFEKERYESVIVSCALGPDLALLENGDETKIGSNGINLSGGQKARVALARAVYAKSKYVLLDDPLSAVDSTTAHLLVNKLFSGPLLRHRTVLLVTHHVAQALPCAQYIVKMDSGQIKLRGYVQDLKASGELSSLIPEDHVTGEPIQRNENSPLQDLESESKSLDGRRLYERRTASDESSKEEIYDATLRWSSFVTYLRASSMKTWFGLGILAIIFQILKLIERYWLKTWMEIEGNHQWFKNSKAIVSDKRIDSMLISVSGHPLFSVGIHVLLGSCAVFITLLFGLVECHAASVASKNLFQRLLLAVSHSTLRWIDETPSGRILNRFTRDIGTIDTTLSTSLQTIIMSLIAFVSSLITLAFAFPPFLIPSICLGILYYKLADMYVRTARNLRQMESKSYSPIFSGFGELMDGIVTVRAFSAEDRFRDLMFQKIDASSNLWYQYWMTGRWLQIRFDFLSGLAVLITNILAITATLPGSAGWAALCITSASSLTNNIYWACRSWTQLELDLNSVERIAQYFNCPQEEHINEEKSCPPQKWPELSGPNKDALIVAKNLEISYAPDLPAVLHDVSFTFRTQERIAIVGRTGSGKSTLTTALLRLINPSKGSITIDGIDINKVPLRDLRSRITIIPQDTILFSGTIKQNLDPLDEYNESECLGALTRVHLRPSSLDETAVVSKTQVRSDDMNNAPEDNKQQILHLNSPVNPGGSNFSTGQRQLIALARALLRRSTIIIFDEATGSLDFETDSIIQKVIREETKGSLLLTVAHRLHTVIDYDKILVLDKGRVVEFDTPFNLWDLEEGVFKEMCMGNGGFTFAKDPVEKKIRAI